MSGARSTLKLSLNLPMLEKMLGQELLVEVGTSVVQQFADKHLKALLGSSTYLQTEQVIRAGIAEEVAEQIGKVTGSYYSGTKVELNTKIQSKIATIVDCQVYDKLKELVDSAVQNNMKTISGRIARKVSEAVDKEIRTEVSRRFQEKLNQAQLILES